MDINQIVFTDEALAVIDNGTWVDIPGMDGVALKVCGMQSVDARKAIEAEQAKARAKNGGEPLSAEQHAEITKKVLGEVVLKDWKGFTDKGQPLPYDKQLAKGWLTKRNGEKLANMVLFAAQKVDSEAQSFVDAATKN